MLWRTIWYDSSGRLRCGWRVVLFLLLLAMLAEPIFFMLGPLISRLWPGDSLLGGMLIQAVILTPLILWLSLLALRALDRLPGRTIGLPVRGNWPGAVLVGICVGIGLIMLAIGALSLLGIATVHWRPLGNAENLLRMLAACGVLLFVAVQEELFVHGYCFQTLLRGIGPLGALACVNVCFALLHLGNPVKPGPLALTNLLLGGMLFGLLYLRTGTLWLPIGLHAGWNFGQLLFHLPLSGIDLHVSSPFVATLTGPALLTGGKFGLEGSVIASVVLLLPIALVTYSRRGLPFESAWWEWRELVMPLPQLHPWDVTIGTRHYQWKLTTREPSEN